MSVGGSGETHLEMRRRLLSEKEAKIRKELRHIENQRKQNRTERVNKHVPQIALIGYTNAGSVLFVYRTCNSILVFFKYGVYILCVLLF